jgi:8-oxo-dGTP pyrophosphatase MutT (NUDIX family)
MNLVYALEETPATLHQSIFLVGPTPRREGVPSWRPAMVEQLKKAGYDGTVFIPEPRHGKWQGDYLDQPNWEQKHLNLCDAIVAWVPRDLKDMPAFTTNVEFGRYVSTRKLFYGRPPMTPLTTYLDWLYDAECGFHLSHTIEELAETVCAALKGREAERSGGERSIPIQIWESEMFQQWYQSHRQSGNRIDDAVVLWTYFPRPDFLLSFVLKVNIWVAAEQRHKSNEYIFSRTNLTTVIPIWKDPATDSILATKVLMVKEFRSPVQNRDSFVREFPSGSDCRKNSAQSREVAAKELEEETGLVIPPERLAPVSSRQLCATLSTHRSYLYLVELTDDEILDAEDRARLQVAHGAEHSSERTYVEVRTIGELLRSDDADYTTLGMLIDGIAWISGVGGKGKSPA